MCDCYTPAGEPIPTNKRHNAAKIFSHSEVAAEEPWYACLSSCPVSSLVSLESTYLIGSPSSSLRYGIEQEYTLLQKDVKWPLGWPVGGFPGPQVNNLGIWTAV